jgi:hypothetical protein
MRYGSFTRAIGYRALLAQLWVWAWVLLLTYAAGLLRIVPVECVVAVVGWLSSFAAVAVAALVAMRRSR